MISFSLKKVYDPASRVWSIVTELSIGQEPSKVEPLSDEKALLLEAGVLILASVADAQDRIVEEAGLRKMDALELARHVRALAASIANEEDRQDEKPLKAGVNATYDNGRLIWEVQSEERALKARASNAPPEERAGKSRKKKRANSGSSGSPTRSRRARRRVSQLLE